MVAERTKDKRDKTDESLEEILIQSAKVDIQKVANELRKDFLSPEDWAGTPEEHKKFVEAWAIPNAKRLKANTKLEAVPSFIELEDKHVGLVMVTVKAPWHAIAAFEWGGWNAVPPDPVLIAAIRHWHKRHEAVPMVLYSDSIELWFEKPLTDPQAASDLAVMISGLCPDTPDQNHETLEGYAQSLLENPILLLWWD